MLTFNVMMRNRDLLYVPIPRLLLIFDFRFFFSIRPADPISGNAFDAKRKKGAMVLQHKNISYTPYADRWRIIYLKRITATGKKNIALSYAYIN